MLKLDKIYKSYGRAHILNGASLEINKGDCIAIIGGNGCGKTTLVQILCGIIRADKGRVINGSRSVEKGEFKHLFGYLPQNDPLIDELSVKDNLKLWFSSMGVPFKNHPLLKKLKIDTYLNKPVNKLSGGMKRRVSLCIAMANEAPILVMDEPTTALDIVAKDEMWAMLSEYMSDGGTVVLTTHNYDEIKNCTRLILMKNGVLKEINKDATYNEIVEYLNQGGKNE